MPNRPQLPGSNLYGLSEALWSDIPTDMIFGKKDRDVGIGFFDDFIMQSNTSLYDGYIKFATGTGTTWTQITSEANHFGILRGTIGGSTINDEFVIQPGGGIDVGPYMFAATPLVFEAYIRISSVAAKWSWFVGMGMGGAAGAAITDKLFADTTCAVYGTTNLVGFQHLLAETTAVDGMYVTSGQTKVDGAVNTDLDTLKIGSTGAGVFAIDTWYKLGIRFDPTPKRVSWWVNGVEQAHIKAAAIEAAAFPDTVFMQPTIGLKDGSGSSAGFTFDVDWWAVAQLTA